ncbi:MFS transporter [Nonomuraea sp. NPDC050556]|uniref:MFS transporter n=1 Tax=Nonomuraea sp. NPDC050556 TaxID=3364369 RepID=UPI003792627C
MSEIVRSLVPARMDRLPWARFHTRVVIALGAAWVLDGLEITIASLVGPVLQRQDTLHLTSAEVGLAATIYLIGEVVGSLYFGFLSDRLGRRKLFLLTLGIYLAASALSAFSPNLWVFLILRFVAGTGIGGEYAAVNSAIDELIPARYRGHTDLAVNGTYWLGAIIGTAGTYILLNPDFLPANIGWRIGFLIGPVIGLALWQLRRHIPESPRWQLTHGHAAAAEETVAQIEAEVERETGKPLPPVDKSKAIEVRPEKGLPLIVVARTLFRTYPTRSLVAVSLMTTQSFLYNAIFFSSSLVLTHFFGVSASTAPAYFFFFAIGNLLGPLLLGRFFDTVGRKKMIAGTYISSGVLLAISGMMFQAGLLTALTQTLLWSAIFFIASAAASSAYLTVSEIFPIEMRAQAISIFFAIGQLVGAMGPTIFGSLIGDQEHPATTGLFIGYLVGACAMIAGGLIEAKFGINAERQSLEDIAEPLTSVRKAAGKLATRMSPKDPPLP